MGGGGVMGEGSSTALNLFLPTCQGVQFFFFFLQSSLAAGRRDVDGRKSRWEAAAAAASALIELDVAELPSVISEGIISIFGHQMGLY